MRLLFSIDPVPASRPRVPRFGKPYYLPTYETFRQGMNALVCTVPKKFSEPLRADVTFFKLVPKSLSKKKRAAMDGQYCESNIDLDNLEKAIYDSLTGYAYDDDSQIVEHSTRKKWTLDYPRIEIELNPV